MSDEEWKQFLARLYGGGATAGGGIMQGITPVAEQTIPAAQGIMDTGSQELNHHTGAGVTYNNASGTDPMMMAGANAVGTGVNNIGLPTQLQNAVNDQFRINNSNFAGTGEPNMDAVPPNLTQEQYQMWLRIPDHLKDSFISGLADGSYSPYAMEQQMGY
jgi:hypothetical protein